MIAVFGVACWEKWDPVRAVQHLCPGPFRRRRGSAGGGHRQAGSKAEALRIDFIRRGDNQLADPPYEWVYW